MSTAQAQTSSGSNSSAQAYSTPFEMRKDLRSKCDRFRILIIGNANAGKTTILQKVCNANGRQPVFFDSAGQEVRITFQTSLCLHSKLVSAQTVSTLNPSRDVRCLGCTLDPITDDEVLAWGT